MELFLEKCKGVFNTGIKKGTLIWAKKDGWDAGIPGFVSSVSEDRLVVMFHPDVSNVVNHYIVPAEEVAENRWQVRWSEDLAEINELVMDGGGDSEAGGTYTEEAAGKPGIDRDAG